MHVSHIVILRRKGGEEFLILWDDVSENISFRASPALYVFYIHTGVL